MSRDSILWVQAKELGQILRLMVWIYGLKEFEAHFGLFFKRVKRLYINQLIRRRNNRFVFTYLKECYTLLVSVIYSDTTYIPKVRVSVDKSGLPRIIPAPLRSMLRTNRSVLIGIFTVLGLHRIIKYEPKADLKTITAPFNGVSKVLNRSSLEIAKLNLVKLAGFSLGVAKVFTLKIPAIKGLIIMKSGPNGPEAFRRIFLDAFALLKDLNLLLALSKWYLKYGGKRYLLSLFLILLLGMPFYFINGFLSSLHLGRLGVVFNVSGKARVVAMTNWWIQIALHPLHKSIFDLLAKLPTDGTFNQMSPIKRLTAKDLNSKFYSLDLSAATDRLPIELQVQILSMFIGSESAQLWKTLLSVPYHYETKREILTVKYEVGQPMGAYSSWAMLALTHHIIVLLAAQGSSHSINLSNPFQDYAVLGDDVVIQNDAIADRYLHIMQNLGVEISIAKSMIAKDHCEFAKRVFNKQGETMSMISPGLFLAVARNRYLIGMLVAEAFARKLCDVKDIVKLIQTAPTKLDTVGFGLWSLYGLRGLISNDQLAALKWGVNWITAVSVFPETAVRMRFSSLFAYPLKEAALMLFDKKVIAADRTNTEKLKSWYIWFNPNNYNFVNKAVLQSILRFKNLNLFTRWTVSLMTLVVNLLTTIMVVCSPIPYLVLDDILCALGDLPNERIRRGPYTVENAVKIASEIRELNVSLIGDIAVKSDVNKFVLSYRDLVEHFIKVQSEIIKDDDVMSRMLLNPDKKTLKSAYLPLGPDNEIYHNDKSVG